MQTFQRLCIPALITILGICLLIPGASARFRTAAQLYPRSATGQHETTQPKGQLIFKRGGDLIDGAGIEPEVKGNIHELAGKAHLRDAAWFHNQAETRPHTVAGKLERFAGAYRAHAVAHDALAATQLQRAEYYHASKLLDTEKIKLADAHAHNELAHAFEQSATANSRRAGDLRKQHVAHLNTREGKARLASSWTFIAKSPVLKLARMHRDKAQSHAALKNDHAGRRDDLLKEAREEAEKSQNGSEEEKLRKGSVGERSRKGTKKADEAEKHSSPKSSTSPAERPRVSSSGTSDSDSSQPAKKARTSHH